MTLRSTFQTGLCVGVVFGLLVTPWAWPWWLLCGGIGIDLVRAVTPGPEDRR